MVDGRQAQQGLIKIFQPFASIFVMVILLGQGRMTWRSLKGWEEWGLQQVNAPLPRADKAQLPCRTDWQECHR